MNVGDVVLCRLPQVGGGPVKLRPALLLVALPGPYQTVLLCGISTQIHTLVANWEELIEPSDADFTSSGLRAASIIRLSYLVATGSREIVGVIGSVDLARLDRLRTRLADDIRP
jgi:mRNA interferase MazF